MGSPSSHWNVPVCLSACWAKDSSAVIFSSQTGMKRSVELFSSSGKVSWTLSAFLPAESLTPTPSGISTLNQIKSVFLATGAFSLLSPLAALLPPPDALPPQPTRASAAKRAMQRERIDRVFFFIVASSLSVGDIMAPHVVGASIAFAADVLAYGAAIPPFVVCDRCAAMPQRVPYL